MTNTFVDYMRESFTGLLVKKLKVSNEVASMLFAEHYAQLQKEWGGDRAYIAKTCEDAKAEMTARDNAIIRDMNKGERVALISTRYCVSRKRVYQIWDAYLLARRKRE